MNKKYSFIIGCIVFIIAMMMFFWIYTFAISSSTGAFIMKDPFLIFIIIGFSFGSTTMVYMLFLIIAGEWK